MKAFFYWWEAFLVSGSFWVYVLIFIGQVFQVSMGTLHLVLVNRGEKFKGSLVRVVEVSLWLILLNSVLEGWKEDVFKAVIYVLACACGSYVGASLDELLAFGMSSLQAVVPTFEENKRLVNYLRCRGHGVTTINVKGRDVGEHYMLMMVIKRKNLKCVMEDIKHICPEAMVTVSDVRVVRNGHIRNAEKYGGTMSK